MASVQERNGRYFARVRRRGFPTATKTFTRKTDAAAWARRVEADMEAGRWNSSGCPVPSLRDAIEIYRHEVAPALKGADTYRYRLDEFAKLGFASLSIDKVLPEHLAAWRDQQLARFKPSTVARKLGLMGSIFSWAEKERQWLVGSPVRRIRMPKVNDGRDRTLSDEEKRWILVAARSSKATWLAPALTLLMTSAMRRGELACLRVEDVDLPAGVALLTETKGGVPRQVPLSAEASAAMQQLVEQAVADRRSRLLPTGPAGSVSTRFKVTVARAVRLHAEHCQQGGMAVPSGFLEDLRLHDLRHHAVTHWATTGNLSMAELMAVSGHRSMRMLHRYTHLRVSTLAAKLRAIDGAPAASPDPGDPTPQGTTS